MHNRDTKYLNSAIMIKVNFRRSHSVETMRCLVQGGGREGGGGEGSLEKICYQTLRLEIHLGGQVIFFRTSKR